MSHFLRTGVTFGEFARLAEKNGFSQGALIEQCQSWWEGHDRVEAFAKRVFLPMYKDVVIPYRALLTLYAQWYAIQVEEKNKVCACGCGKSLVGSFRRYASRACKQRHFRNGH